MFLGHFFIRSGDKKNSNLIKLIVHAFQLINDYLYYKVQNENYAKEEKQQMVLRGRHLGKDSITIIVFSCALTAEEYSNKPVQENIDKRLG